jgi:predicted AAA+ superfamily ATPase
MQSLKDVKRITLELAPGVETEFVDRDRALAQVKEWAERRHRFPIVIFGPEGCGKTAFLRQAAAGLGSWDTTCSTSTLLTEFLRLRWMSPDVKKALP